MFESLDVGFFTRFSFFLRKLWTARVCGLQEMVRQGVAGGAAGRHRGQVYAFAPRGGFLSNPSFVSWAVRFLACPEPQPLLRACLGWPSRVFWRSEFSSFFLLPRAFAFLGLTGDPTLLQLIIFFTPLQPLSPFFCQAALSR